MNKRGLNLSDLRHINQKRCEENFHSGGSISEWSLTDWACALAGEVGEACNIVKKIRRIWPVDLRRAAAAARDGRIFTSQDLLDKLADELADTIIYADLLAARAGIDLGAAIHRKFNAVSDEIGSRWKLEGDTLPVFLVDPDVVLSTGGGQAVRHPREEPEIAAD